MVRPWKMVACLVGVLLVPSALGRSACRFSYEHLAVRAAFQALETGDAAGIVIWVGREHEAAVRDALAKARKVRVLSPEARDVADGYFIQALSSYASLSLGRKPEPGQSPELGPAVPSAEKAVEADSADRLTILLMDMMRQEMARRFKAVLERKRRSAGDLEAGRRYVHAYAEFVGYVAGLYSAIRGDGEPAAGTP